MKAFLLQCFLFSLLAVLAIYPVASAASQDDQPSLTHAIGKWYLRFQRDRVIRNYQNRIRDNVSCAGFRDRLEAAGMRHDSAATGGFALDMQKLLREAASQDCFDCEQDWNRIQQYAS